MVTSFGALPYPSNSALHILTKYFTAFWVSRFEKTGCRADFTSVIVVVSSENFGQALAIPAAVPSMTTVMNRLVPSSFTGSSPRSFSYVELRIRSHCLQLNSRSVNFEISVSIVAKNMRNAPFANGRSARPPLSI